MNRNSSYIRRSLLLLGVLPAAVVGLAAVWAARHPWLLPVGLCLALAVVLWLTRRLGRPLDDLTSALRRLRLGDWSARTAGPAPRGLDEVVRDFNALADGLGESRAEMQAEIDQTTSDLRQTMEALEIRNVEIDLARRRAVEASRVKSEFLASMSHEIRTPLNGITGFTNLLAKTSLSPEQRDYVETISRSSADLLDIINDILDFSKLESGKLSIDRQVFDVRECLDEAVVFLAPGAHAKDLELVLMIYNDVPDFLEGDPTRLRQVLTNLVNNAIKFTRDGEVVVRAILADEGEQACRLEITVSDTGIGIAEKLLSELFVPFNQASTTTSRLYGGSGLGLSICRKLVQSMGGEIEVESREGEGSVFRFSLPMGKPGPDALPGAHPRARAGARVALYDGHRVSAASIRGRLEHAGLDVAHFSDLDELLADRSAPDAPVVLGFSAKDCRSGRLNQALAALRQKSKRPTLVMVGTSDRAELDRVVRIGADRCIPKPASDASLLDALGDLLTASKVRPRRKRRIQTAGPPALPHHHFLVADDNPVNLKLIATLLAGSGAHVSRATNGREVLELLDTVRFDLVLLDIHMPEMDGLAAAQAIRARGDQAAERLPIVALTADVAPRKQEEIFAAGMDDYLVKPVSETRLWSVITRLLGPESLDVEEDAAQGRQTLTLSPDDGSELWSSATALRVTGGNAELAEDMFEMLVEGLPDQLQQIGQYLRQRHWDALHDQVHRLQGSTAVCGVPQLHATVRA
ncbi:MAG: ATP-binding protein, partial [Chromatiales bacterium]